MFYFLTIMVKTSESRHTIFINRLYNMSSTNSIIYFPSYISMGSILIFLTEIIKGKPTLFAWSRNRFIFFLPTSSSFNRFVSIWIPILMPIHAWILWKLWIRNTLNFSILQLLSSIIIYFCPRYSAVRFGFIN